MKKIWTFLFASSFISSAAFGFLPTGTITWDLGLGYRHDDLKWSIAGPFNYPNVLSELEWKNIQSAVVSGQFKMSYCTYLYFRTNADYGWIVDGKNTDADYDFNNRRGVFAFSKSKANGGNVWDASVATGWTFPFDCDTLWINPLFGYAIQHQNLCMKKGNQLIYDPNPDIVGPIHGLNSTYSAQWKGFFGGLDADYYFESGFEMHGLFEYHWNTQYHGIGHWNLRHDIGRRFHHKAQGWGIITGLQLDYRFACFWLAGLSGGYSYFRTKNGVDHTPVWFDHSSYEVSTRLNPVEWRSYNVKAHLSYQF